MVVAHNDGLDNFKRSASTQTLRAEFSHIQPGVVTKVVAGSNAAFVKLPLLNENSEVGPYKCLQPFVNQVTVDDAAGTYGALVLPSIGDRVVVVLMNGSLDDGVIMGKI